MQLVIFALIPIILSIGITPVLPFSYSEELVCPSGEVEVVRITNPNSICIDQGTAHRWTQLGITKIVAEPIEESKQTVPEIVEPEEIISKFQYPLIPNDLSRAKSYLVTISGGELPESIIIQTFSKIEPGDQPKYITSFHGLGFDTYFSLESIPSKDKIEFYQLVEETINPGRPPELFDVSIDVLSGDNSVIITVNYPKCEITNYAPYSQEFVLFYQYSDAINEEIRDRTILYCAGLSLQVYDEENQKIIPTELLPFIPSKDDSVQGYVVHFSGADFDGIYTVETFSDFSPSVNFIETPFDVITVPGNPLGAKPQFFLESLPSKDKENLYKYFAKWVNPGQAPELVNVSVDMITGDETILQRWNYKDCSFYDYTMHLEDSLLKYSYTGEQSPEIRDKSEFTCNGMNLEIDGDKPLTNFPLKSIKTAEEESIISPTIPESTERAQYFEISVFGGELTQVNISERLLKFEPIKRDRGPLTPLTHDKQYDFGFVVESLPQKEKTPIYEFISRYVNPGKTPEPFDVNIDTINGDGTILHRLQYVNCDSIDFWWYLQQANWFYQFSQKEQDEIRERYIFYCEGFGIDFP
ncbi:MAG: hypothetical protein OEM77_05370 [Nitrosopumilus sp.]|nr:hypothetical protein [Nitrosopumilus sp.]MDH3833202.1 hypothetical protein [Nitrosopumilus sp.]